MSHLATALFPFYSRRGNRVIFRNGDTLNALSLTISERSGSPGFDAAALSRVVKGTRLFTKRQLNAFCNILSLSKDEKDALFRAMAKDILDRYAITRGTLHKKGMYAKFLEYFMKEGARHIGGEESLKHYVARENVRLIRNVLDQLRRSFRQRPSLWRAQSASVMGLIAYCGKKGSGMYVFQPDRK